MNVVTDASLAERIAAHLTETPNAMTVEMARQFGVAEAEIVANLPDNRGLRLDALRAEALIREFETLGNVHVIVTNATVVSEVFGQFGKFSRTGPYFNVQTKTLDMHIRIDEIAHVFAVEKPSHLTGKGTVSFQFYDTTGRAAMKVFLSFGNAETSEERRTAFERLRDAYRIEA